MEECGYSKSAWADVADHWDAGAAWAGGWGSRAGDRVHFEFHGCAGGVCLYFGRHGLVRGCGGGGAAFQGDDGGFVHGRGGGAAGGVPRI